MITYAAIRSPRGVRLYRHVDDETAVEIHARRSQRVRNHSPGGFEFGYAGSGPTQLALAILLDCLGQERAESLYQKFKRDHVVNRTGEAFQIEDWEILAWAARIEAGA